MMRARNMQISLAALLLASASLVACFRERHEVVQIEEGALLCCTGNTEGTLLTVRKDEQTLFREIRVDAAQRYPLPAGPCEVVIARGGSVVVHRKILLVEGQVFELSIP